MSDFGARKVRVQHQSRLFTEQALVTGRLQSRTAIGGHPALPHNRIGHRPSGIPFPHHCGLTLIGNPHSRQVAGIDSSICQHRASGRQLSLPDRLGIVLDVTRRGVDLLKLLLGNRHDPSRIVKDDRAAGGGALIESQNVLRHPLPSSTRPSVGFRPDYFTRFRHFCHLPRCSANRPAN